MQRAQNPLELGSERIAEYSYCMPQVNWQAKEGQIT